MEAILDECLTITSEYPVRETMDRLEASARTEGLMTFARIDHAKGAASVGVPLQPMELLIFGNPRAGTRLIQANPLLGIDLPLRALVWQGGEDKTRVSAVDPGFLIERRGVASTEALNVAQAMTRFLTRLMQSAAKGG